jgi:hypothetical protein
MHCAAYPGDFIVVFGFFHAKWPIRLQVSMLPATYTELTHFAAVSAMDQESCAALCSAWKPHKLLGGHVQAGLVCQDECAQA